MAFSLLLFVLIRSDIPFSFCIPFTSMFDLLGRRRFCMFLMDGCNCDLQGKMEDRRQGGLYHRLLEGLSGRRGKRGTGGEEA
ncbi:hypothetical protein BKA64DRAFT_219453 [Cadophora sp. MPI-SDFR-AT-0126]|nr:hypothetical protein BKA64DRAFT_219453 [Leotiomycetes sp. MPI-SDFR-AT-0126]